jgi:hypothetical protein
MRLNDAVNSLFESLFNRRAVDAYPLGVSEFLCNRTFGRTLPYRPEAQ